MAKWIPMVVAALVALSAVIADPVQQVVVAHPGWSAAVAGVIAVLNALFKSPVQPK